MIPSALDMSLAALRRCSLGPCPRPFATALIALVVVALLLQGATLPHRHDTRESALYNQEHDLTLLAALGIGATLPDVVPVAFQLVAVSVLPAATAAAPRSPRHHRAAPRAPPA